MGGYKRSKLIKILGIEGKRLDIIPTTRGLNLTELYCKRENMDTGYMGAIAYSPEWKKYVLIDLDNDFQMSKECINEAFDMVEKYWGGKIPEIKPGGESPG